jgi:hypothetical protein
LLNINYLHQLLEQLNSHAKLSLHNLPPQAISEFRFRESYLDQFGVFEAMCYVKEKHFYRSDVSESSPASRKKALHKKTFKRSTIRPSSQTFEVDDYLNHTLRAPF